MIDPELKPIEWTPQPTLFQLLPQPLVFELTALASQITWKKLTGKELPKETNENRS